MIFCIILKLKIDNICLFTAIKFNFFIHDILPVMHIFKKNNPITDTGVMMSIMIIPKTISSCFPDMIFGIPILKIPYHEATIASSIHTIPNF